MFGLARLLIFSRYMWPSNSTADSKKVRVIFSFTEQGIQGDVLLWSTSL